MAFELLQHEGEPLQVWFLQNTYQGVTPVDGKTLHVVRVNEKIIDPDVGEYIVTAVGVDNVPTLRLVVKYTTSGQADQESDSLITALSMRQPNSTAKAFYDTSVNPPSITIDGRFLQYGAEATSMIFFRGVDTTAETGEVISEMYTADGVYDGAIVPLIVSDSVQPTWKIVDVFYSTADLKSGDIITGVAYKANGGKFTKEPFIIEESAAIRPLSQSTVSIEAITLTSPLLDPTNQKLLLNALNTTFSTSLVTGLLHYTDGSQVPVNIDGNKCVLHGVDRFDTSRMGEPSEVIISYYPGATEPFINGGMGAKNHVSAMYFLANRRYADDYSFKLWPIPTFNGEIVGYTFHWRLTNLAGDIDIDVTDYVTAVLSDGSDLRGNNYGVVQTVTLALPLTEVIPGIYDDYVHTQRMDITLSIPSSANWSPWVYDFIGGGINNYGVNQYSSATNVNGGIFVIDFGQEDVNNWLTKVYDESAPLWDSSVQEAPTVPTHFRLEYNGVTDEYPIADYAQEFAKVSTAPAFANNQTMNIVWIFRSTDGDLILGMSPVLIRLDL